MSGHSKFANIRHKKEKNDAKKGKIFTMLGREIQVAVKAGGPDPNVNGKLRDVIAKCKSNNMPNDTIQRSIKKASGEINAINYEEITYEGYGIGGSAVIVKCLTDNKNRSAGDVRHAFDKMGGSLGATGCVSYMFENKGLLYLEKKADMVEDDVIMMCLEAEAEDVVDDGDCYEIITTPANFTAVKENLEGQGLVFDEAAVELVPQSTIKLDSEQMVKFEKLIDMLEELDDVQEVFHNVDLPDEE